MLCSRIKALLILALGLFGSATHAVQDTRSVKDIAYGPVLFQFHQKNFFSAITELQVAQNKGLLRHHADEAELLLGGLYLSYGMQRTAEEIFNRLLDQQVTPHIRNQAWLQLASIYHERGYGEKAQELLARMESKLSSEQKEEKAVLEGLILLQQQRYEAAGRKLAAVDEEGKWRTYARYNLGVELLRQGNMAEGKAILDQIASMGADGDGEQLMIRDKANIALGYNSLINQMFDESLGYFEDVGLEGPFANQAMLGLGWAEYASGRQQDGLSTWLTLIERDAADPPVLEALLAVPYTLNRLGAYQQALDYYRLAIDSYNDELSSIERIVSGMDFSTLIKKVVNADSDPEAGWYWRADVQPDDEFSPYLFQLLAGNEFQEALKQYRDLLFLDKHLVRRISDLDAFEGMVDTRQMAYAQRLPAIRAALGALDGYAVHQRRDRHGNTLDSIESNGDAFAFANATEEAMLERLSAAAARIDRLEGGVNIALQKNKYRVLNGMLLWRLETEYPLRLWDVKKRLKQLDEALVKTTNQRDALNRTLKSTPNNFEYYRERIRKARITMSDMRQKIGQLAIQYERNLGAIAEKNLKRFEIKIQEFRSQALFAAGQISDRAVFEQKGQP